MGLDDWPVATFFSPAAGGTPNLAAYRAVALPMPPNRRIPLGVPGGGWWRPICPGNPAYFAYWPVAASVIIKNSGSPPVVHCSASRERSLLRYVALACTVEQVAHLVTSTEVPHGCKGLRGCTPTAFVPSGRSLSTVVRRTAPGAAGGSHPPRCLYMSPVTSTCRVRGRAATSRELQHANAAVAGRRVVLASRRTSEP